MREAKCGFRDSLVFVCPSEVFLLTADPETACIGSPVFCPKPKNPTITRFGNVISLGDCSELLDAGVA
jgi:hypothetical protein